MTMASPTATPFVTKAALALWNSCPPDEPAATDTPSMAVRYAPAPEKMTRPAVFVCLAAEPS